MQQNTSAQAGNSQEANIATITEIANELVIKARQCGVVLNIESVPDQPLAMGNYHEVVSVRSVREKS